MSNRTANPSEKIAEKIPIETAPRNDIDKITAIFLSAFRDDPMMRYFFSMARDVQKAIGVSFRYMIEKSRINGVVFRTSAAYEGAAIWCLTGFSKSPFNLDLQIAWFMLNQFKVADLKRFVSFYLRAEKAHRRIIHKPHYYLELLGVDARFQGMGFASKLVRPVLAHADQNHTDCYLETHSEKNVDLYKYYGFEMAGTIQPGFSGDAYYLMLRKAKKGKSR
ncbi:MAG: GNAT family N-acetyltransferase [Anaerolineaceae bacterium]|nr:GNAT family N-acetyltransferase [Anaerolineaceae bacterium]